MGLREAIGRVIGGAISPIIALGSLARGARLFHPDGVVFSAEVKPLSTEGEIGALAQRLAGPALVRLSPGIQRWREGERVSYPDVLGVSVRFRSSQEITPVASVGDQDLLFLSFRHLFLLPIAVFTTNTRDFFENNYYAQLPFDAAGVGKVKFRLMPLRAAAFEGNRREKLEQAAAAGLALLRLEVRKAGMRTPWRAVVEIALREQVDIDQKALQFDPFRTGRGIVPTGLLQAIRLAAYPASFLGRRLATRGDRPRDKDM